MKIGYTEKGGKMSVKAIHPLALGMQVVPREYDPSKFNYTIQVNQVNRQQKPLLDYVDELVHPELPPGPPSYDLRTDIEEWVSLKQKRGIVHTYEVYESIKKLRILKKCLSLNDFRAILAKGPAVYRIVFQGKTPIAWKSVGKHRCGELAVPRLIERNGQVAIETFFLDSLVGANSPALLFSSDSGR